MRVLIVAAIIFASIAMYFGMHIRTLMLAQAKLQEQIRPHALINPHPAKQLVKKTPTVRKDPLILTYTLSHAEDSPVNSVPLKKATLNIQVYYYGNPKGQIRVVTDENQSFAIGKFKSKSAVGVEVLTVENEREYEAHCRGYAAPGTTQIAINCKPKRWV